MAEDQLSPYDDPMRTELEDVQERLAALLNFIPADRR